MKVICELETYDLEDDNGNWLQNVEMTSDELHGNRVRLVFVGERELIFMADDLEQAIQRCRKP